MLWSRGLGLNKLFNMGIKSGKQPLEKTKARLPWLEEELFNPRIVHIINIWASQILQTPDK
jgi:hypothetical protein